MTPSRDPMVPRRRLRTELRQARTNAGLKQQAVADAMDWSLSKVIRIESGAVNISTNDLRALLRLYGIEGSADVEQFVELARASRESPWWSAYRDAASSAYLAYLGYESSASTIDQFHPIVVPGLLQHEDYIRAILQQSLRVAAEQDIKRRFELRLRRQQELFERSDPPDMTFVLDEAVLHRLVGGHDVMRRQLDHLRDAAARDNVTIQVVPFSAGAYPAMTEPFVILDLPALGEDLLYFEGPRESLVVRENQEEISFYRDTFTHLRSLAEQTDLERMLEKVRAEILDNAR